MKRRGLALCLVLAMLAGMLVVPARAAEENVVFVGLAEGAEAPEGAVTAQTLEQAYALLDSTAGGTIVICGPVDFRLDGAAPMPGEVTLTARYQDWDYRDSGVLNMTGAVELTGNTVLEQVRIALAASGTTSLFLYSGRNLTIRDSVTVSGCDDSHGRLKLCCGSLAGTEGETVNVRVSGGEFFQIFMGIVDKTPATGNVNLTVDGSAAVTNSIMTGPNKGASGDLTLTVRGGASVANILDLPGTNNCQVGDVVVNLEGGRVGCMKRTDKTGSVIKSYTVNLSGNASVGLNGGTIGDWTGATVTDGTALRLTGYNGELPENAAANYGTITVSGDSQVRYGGALTNARVIVVEEGGSLHLSELECAPEGVSVTGNVTYKTASTPEQPQSGPVWVSGDASITTRDGKTPETAVATLEEAYGLLDQAAGGTIVICGEVAVSGTTDLQPLAVTGPVTLTSVTAEMDYREAGAKLILKDAGTILALGDRTVIDGLDITVSGGSKKVTYLYSGLELRIGEDVAVHLTNNEYLRLFCGRMTDCGDVKVSIASGSYNMITAGATGKTVGNVDLTISGTASVSSNITMGGSGTAVTGDIVFTMDGGEVKVLYATPGSGSVCGNVTMNLNAGKLTAGGEMRDYNGATKMQMGDVTVNLSGSFGLTDGKLGVWNEASFLPGGAPARKVLNISALRGAVSDTALMSYTQVNVASDADVTYGGALASGAKLTVQPGGCLRLTAITRQAAQEAGIEAVGNVIYQSEQATYLTAVYVDGSKAAEGYVGDGSREKPVTDLEQAVALLDPEAEQVTIVLCGPLEISGRVDGSLERAKLNGTVVLTSLDETQDYRSSGAELKISQKNAGIAFGRKTVLENLNIVANGNSVFLYSGNDLWLKENVSITGATMKLFCAKTGSSLGETIRVRLSTGTFNQIFMGGTGGVQTGDVELTIDGETSVTSNVATGPNTGSAGNVTLNMNGGYVKVIYTGNQSTSMGDLTMNLSGGTITEMRDYNGKSGISYKSITVNYGPGFNRGAGKFGVWGDAVTVEGKILLNWFAYNGSDIAGLTAYDTVNLFGGTELPEGVELTPSETGRLVRIVDYGGTLDMDLSIYDALALYGGKEVYCIGQVPDSMKLFVDAGSTLYIRPSQNPGKTLEDYLAVKTGDGQVLFSEPPYGGADPVLAVSFDDQTAADTSGSGNHGRVAGAPVYGTGYDGGKALYLQNAFGKAAEQYLTFPELKNVDISTESYTITMWYRTVNGGLGTWAPAANASAAGTGVQLGAVSRGGVVFSNRDEADSAAPGFAAAQLPQSQFFAAGMTDASGTHRDIDGIWQPQDGRWHHIAMSVDRSGRMNLYVDGALLAAVDISAAAGQTLGVNSLAIGADLMGQYGLGSVWVDDVKLYTGAMDQMDIQANYSIGRLKALSQEITQRVASAGPEYTDAMNQTITAQNDAVRQRLADMELADYAETIALYDSLKADFDRYLLAPADSAGLRLLLTSDLHVASGSDASVGALNTVLKDLDGLKLALDGMLSAGDIADSSKPAAMNAAFDTLDGIIGSRNWQLITSVGNHEVQYTNPSENYAVSMPVYWQRLQAHISADSALRQFGGGTLDDVHYLEDPENDHYHFDYGITLRDYHFLVINTDYLKQTGNSKDVLDENGNYAIEGNDLDPIRHGMHLEEETLDWIRQMLDKYSQDGKPIFVVEHFPFIDSCPLSYYSEIVINDNSIGKADGALRQLLGSYPNVVVFTGHLHSSVAMSGPVRVSGSTGSFTQVNLPSPKAAARGYLSTTTTWILYAYDSELVLRARDSATGEWLTAYDYVIPLTGTGCRHGELTLIEGKEPSCTEDGAKAYYHCGSCGRDFWDDQGKEAVEDLSQTVIPSLGHTLQLRKEVPATCEEEGRLAHYRCTVCQKCFLDAKAEREVSEEALATARLAHKLTKVPAKAATTTAEGNIAHYVCDHCGRLFADKKAEKELTKADTVIPKRTSSSTGPKTGDSFPLGMLLWLMLASGAALTLAWKKRKV